MESARRRTKPRTVDLYDVFCGVIRGSALSDYPVFLLGGVGGELMGWRSKR